MEEHLFATSDFERIITESTHFILGTVDINGFPKLWDVSVPVIREGIHNLKFLIDNQKKIIKDIQKHDLGSVYCFKENEKLGLMFRGRFTILDSNDLKCRYVATKNELIKVVSFETLTIKYVPVSSNY